MLVWSRIQEYVQHEQIIFNLINKRKPQNYTYISKHHRIYTQGVNNGLDKNSNIYVI